LGHHVTSSDIDATGVGLLQHGCLPFHEAGLGELLSRHLEARRLVFSLGTIPCLQETQAIFVCVGTPASSSGAPEMSHFWRALDPLIPGLPPGAALVLKSTVPVGTNAELHRRCVSTAGLQAPHVLSCPEFMQEGAGLQGFLNPSRIVAGVRDKAGLQVLQEALAGIRAPWVVTTPENAEAIKYASNALLAARVSLVNELANLCETLGADILEVTRGAGLDPRIGQAYLEAGAGYGGPCLEKDLWAIIYQAQSHGCETPLLKEVQRVNARQQELVVRKVQGCLGRVSGSVLGILGLAFKPGTDDTRGSPSVAVATLLLSAGAEVRGYDPVASVFPVAAVKRYDDPYSMAEGADALILMTSWPSFRHLDFPRLRSVMKRPVLVDGRNCLAGLPLEGFQYVGIGRNPVGTPRVRD
jgi:UDPglucose 6-dehydrogenase